MCIQMGDPFAELELSEKKRLFLVTKQEPMMHGSGTLGIIDVYMRTITYPLPITETY